MINRTVVELLTNSLFAFFMFRTPQISKSSPKKKKKETYQVDIVSIPVLDTFSTVMQALIVSTECFVYIWTVHDLSIFMCLICRHNCTITFIALPLYYILLLLKAQWPAAAKANGVRWFKIISPVTDAPNTPLSEVRLSDQAEKMG